MTLAVYRIDPRTGVRTLVRARHTVRPRGVPELSSAYPPCACPRCGDGDQRAADRLRALVAEANRRSGEAL